MGTLMLLSFPSSSLLNRMCKDIPLSIYSLFLGCPATLVIGCGVDLSSTLLNSCISDIVLIGLLGVYSLLSFTLAGIFPFMGTLSFLSRSPGSCMVILLDFLLCCCNFLLLIVLCAVCIGFDLRGPTLLGFLDCRTTSFHGTILSSGLVSERTCPKTQSLGKLMENNKQQEIATTQQ